MQVPQGRCGPKKELRRGRASRNGSANIAGKPLEVTRALPPRRPSLRTQHWASGIRKWRHTSMITAASFCKFGSQRRVLNRLMHKNDTKIKGYLRTSSDSTISGGWSSIAP